MPILYTSSTCMPCKMTKKWFNDNGVEFEERNATENEEYAQEMRDMGYTQASLLVYKGEKYFGFLPDTYEVLFAK